MSSEPPESLDFFTPPPEGYSAAQMLEMANGASSGVVQYDDGGETTIDVELSYAGRADYHADCGIVDVQVNLSLTTGDGLFDVQAPASLVTLYEDRTTLKVELGAHQHGLDLARFGIAPGAHDQVLVVVHILFSSTEMSGNVIALGRDEGEKDVGYPIAKF